MKNSIIVIHPEKVQDVWIFSDEKRGIIDEPFVMGIPEIIESLLNGEEKCTMYASDNPFPGSKKLTLIKEDYNGGWYRFGETKMEGWLCPVVQIYFGCVPKEIYFDIKQK